MVRKLFVACVDKMPPPTNRVGNTILDGHMTGAEADESGDARLIIIRRSRALFANAGGKVYQRLGSDDEAF